MSLHIAGIGTAVPTHGMDQEESLRLALSVCPPGANRRRSLRALYRRSGIRRRYSVLLDSSVSNDARLKTCYPPPEHPDDCGPTTGRRMEWYGREAGPLAAVAARRALQAARVDPARVSHLITVSCTGFAAPGVDMSLIEQLGLSAGVSRAHVGFMGCHGALNAMAAAGAIAEAEPNACVLLCAVELCSLHLQYGWHPDRLVANALFSDGAGAIVGLGTNQTRPSRSGLNLRLHRSVRLPATEEMMTWRIGDHGFEMTLSPRVPDVLREHLAEWLSDCLADAGMDITSIGAWAIHPGGPRILSACQQALGLDTLQLTPSQTVFAEHGNMSSPTVVFIVEQLQRSDAPRPWLLIGFGPGLAIEMVLLG